MSRTRWKLLIGILGLSLGSLAAVADVPSKNGIVSCTPGKPHTVARASYQEPPISVPAPRVADVPMTGAPMIPAPATIPTIPDAAPTAPSIPTPVAPTPAPTAPLSIPAPAAPVALPSVPGLKPVTPPTIPTAPSALGEPVKPQVGNPQVFELTVPSAGVEPLKLPTVPDSAPIKPIIPAAAPSPAPTPVTLPKPSKIDNPAPAAKPATAVIIPSPEPTKPIGGFTEPALPTINFKEAEPIKPVVPIASQDLPRSPVEPNSPPVPTSAPTPAPVPSAKPTAAPPVIEHRAEPLVSYPPSEAHREAPRPAEKKLKVMLHMGDERPRFEVKDGDEIYLKVISDKVEVKSPSDTGANMSTMRATGKVQFITPGGDGTCDELSVIPGTGQVVVTGHVAFTYNWGKVETTVSGEKMTFRLGSAPGTTPSSGTSAVPASYQRTR